MRNPGRPSLRIEQATNGGHTMTLHQPEKPSKPGGMSVYQPPESRVYGPGEHEKMFGDARAHLAIKRKMAAAPAPKASGMARNMVADKDKDGY